MSKKGRKPYSNSQSKTANKRTKAQILRDSTVIAELYLRGFSNRQIAERLPERTGADYHISREQVRQDLNKLIDQWREDALEDIDRKKAIELRKLDHLEKTYYEEFERSRRQKVKTTFDDEGNVKKEEQIDEAADPRFLDGVLECISKRCEILGLDAPQQHQVETKLLGDNPTELTDEERREVEQAVSFNHTTQEN